MAREHLFISKIIQIEGGYVNDPSDLGGETKFGITHKTARDNGYNGLMKDLTMKAARDIYLRQYWFKPGFNKITNDQLSFELLDTAVNMGPETAVEMLQKSCNLLNHANRYGNDLEVDGRLGFKTLAFVNRYPMPDRLCMLMNVVQCARYVKIAQVQPEQRKFIYGWLKERVFNQTSFDDKLSITTPINPLNP